jgi:PKD repeat protein
MHSRHQVKLSALLVMTIGALALGAAPSQARAQGGEGYGELTRFGPGGAGVPKEIPGTLNDEHRTRILGVDPSDNSAYVLDEPQEEEQKIEVVNPGQPGCSAEEPEPCEIGVGPVTRHFRLQKFAASGGSYSAVASASFTEPAPAPSEVAAAAAFEAEVVAGWALAVEGIAVDPGLKRVYLLAADYREPTLAIDNAAIESGAKRKALLAASSLYAFSTEPAGNKLKPAVGGSPLLAGPAELRAQASQKDQALMEPAGITVDPATHEVVILGHTDEAGAPQDSIESAQDHYVLQRVHPDGTLGSRFVDRGNFLAKHATRELRPHSPIVVSSPSPEHTEHVYVGSEGALVQIPYNFESGETPSVFFAPLPPPPSIVEDWITTPLQPGAPQGLEGKDRAPVVGGGLSASPEGRIFAAAKINLEEEGSYEAVLALSGSDGSIIGWTGGQSQALHPEGPERYLCVIEPLFYGPSTPVAAGSGGVVFVLAPGFLFDREINEERIQLYGRPGTKIPAVIEFGPGGSGCPAARSREGLVARVKGERLGEKTVNTGEPVTFATELLQGDSIGVEWDFGDGTKESVSANQRKHPETQHAFTRGGMLTVTAKMHTDDLATPTITLTTRVSIAEAAGSPPRALANGPLEAFAGQAALFDGSASSDPNGPNQISEYHWAFGDGHQVSSKEPIVFYTYPSVGSYAVSLTVTNKHGLTSSPYSLAHPVKVVEPPPPAREESKTPSSRQGVGSGQPSGGVASYTHAAAQVPVVTLAVASLRASASGTLPVNLYCAAGETTCAGTITLHAAVTPKDLGGHGHKALSLTLASGGFALGGGSQHKVILRLSRQARALLARVHTLRAVALILAHDPAGATHTTQLAVTVRGPVAASGKRPKH